MTRNDYEALAKAILSTKQKFQLAEVTSGIYVIRMTAEAIADELSADNARFDRSKFLAACGFGI